MLPHCAPACLVLSGTSGGYNLICAMCCAQCSPQMYATILHCSHTHTYTLYTALYMALYMSYACCYLAPLNSIRNTHPHLDMFERALRPPFCRRLKSSKSQCQLSNTPLSPPPLPNPPAQTFAEYLEIGEAKRQKNWP